MTRVPRPFICSNSSAALHVAHEEQALQRLDVGAGGDHVHGDGDARVVAVAEGLDQVLGLDAGDR
jgi:hypothetical protein